MNYYKATRTDGRDFRTGTIDYAAALASGEVIKHPETPKKVRNQPQTYLSVSVAPADCTGLEWPCRLFRVEPVGRVMANLEVSPNKRAVSALRVVEELPAQVALGPNGAQVAAFIERCRSLTPGDWRRVAEAWAVAGYAARNAARNAAVNAAVDAARNAAVNAAWAAAGYAAVDAARNAAVNAAWAITVRDLIIGAQYDLLTQPFVDAGLADVVGR